MPVFSLISFGNVRGFFSQQKCFILIYNGIFVLINFSVLLYGKYQ